MGKVSQADVMEGQDDRSAVGKNSSRKIQKDLVLGIFFFFIYNIQITIRSCEFFRSLFLESFYFFRTPMLQSSPMQLSSFIYTLIMPSN